MANHYMSVIAGDILSHEKTFPASFKKVITGGHNKPRVLIIIGNLASGGKERRLIEMLTYFRKNKDFEFLVVLGNDEIHYKSFHDLQIKYQVLKSDKNHNPVSNFSRLYKICKDFRPHLIHSWGRMQTFYTLPSVLFQKIPLLNSQITSAPPRIPVTSFEYWIDRLNFFFSDLVLSNSKAGIDAYKPPKKKSKVIYNGISPDRFNKLTVPDTIRKTYGIHTPYVVLMAASFSPHKDYDLFFKVAEYVTKKRSDITFIGVGGYMKDDTQYRELVNRSKDNNCILFPGKIKDVESLVNVSDIGVLFSNKKVHGEGISNTIMEYMCLGKPVIANDAGGSREIVFDKCNGYLINDESAEQIGELVSGLIDDPITREKFGVEGQRIIYDNFLLDRMGLAFDNVYSRLLKASW